MRHFLLSCCLVLSAAHADEKALNELWRAYGADQGDVGGLLKLNQEVNDKIVASAAAALLDLDLPVWGDSGAVVIEFSDYQCGYCKRMFPLLERAVDEGRAQVRVVEWPVLGALSVQAARVALAARQGGQYVKFHRRLMGGGRLDEDALAAAAAAAGLDEGVIRALMAPSDSEFDAVLRKNYQLASLLRLSGTPAFVINGRVVRGALSEDEFNRLLAAQ